MNAQNLKLYIKAISDFSDVQSNVKNVQQVLEKLKLPDNLKKNFTGLFTSFEKEAEKYQKFLNSGFKTKKDVTGLEQAGKNITQILTKIQSQMGSISTSHLKEVFKIDSSALVEAQNRVAEIQKQAAAFSLKGFSVELGQVNRVISDLGKFSKNPALQEFQKAFAAGDIVAAESALQKLSAATKKFRNDNNKEAWGQGVTILRQNLEYLGNNPGMQTLNQQLNQARGNLENIQQVEFSKFINQVGKIETGMKNTNTQFQSYNKNVQNSAQNTNKLNSELETLKYQTTYFFGLTNSINLFKRALREAYQTVKELDAAMTATAVVTDFTVSDMWTQLPEYTRRANELGVAVKGAYEAATLYYQQGLKTDEVIAVSNETLKMARIAGMDYAEATDSMTAALRGFNMEVNEASAQKVNDVYSKLAAITASDTQEISTAMSKTASIAASANMEFETTAAFLSQIIETTREAPETAGTALKTVIARFQELKKNPSEIGEVEGEIVDANKIETALRTIDVALRDTNGQFRALDDVFLDIAAKWQDLDTNTQRYIATMAAGSRQQSRFIAMMSDYGRTMELVGAANNSVGASQAQFEKTLDSLESKIAKLDNAWNEFTMGIANNVAIKTGVDLLTLLLNTVNNVTGILPSGVDSIAKLGIALLGLRTGLKIFDTFWINLENKMGPVAAITNATRTAFTGLGKVFTARFWVQKGPAELFNQLVKQSPAAIGAIDAETAAAARLGQIYNLNHAQQRAFIAAKKAGIDTTIALAMAQDKEALSALESAQAEAISTGAEEANTKTKIENIAASFAKNKQEKVEQVEKQKGIALKLADTLAITGETIAKKLHIKALITENGILKASNALKAKAILLTLGMTAAIVGLVFVFKKLYDVMKDNTPEARLKKLQESIEDSEEAAKSAKDAYENLFSAKTEYEDIQDKLDGLVKGTKEWEQALFEANNQVLDLINSYDNLQVKNNNGRLEIINWDDILEQQRQQVANTTISASIANLELKQEEEAQAKVGIRTSTNSYTKEFREELIDAFDSGKLAEALAGGVESADYQEIREQFGLTIFELEELIPTLQEYKKSLISLDNASDNLANTLVANLSEEVSDSDYTSSVTRKFAELQTKNQTQDIQNRKNELDRKYITSELQKLYKEVSGQEADSEWKQDKLAEEIAKLQISQEYLNSTEELIGILDKSNKNTQKAIEGFLSDGNSLTRDDFDLVLDENNQQLIDAAKLLGVEVTEIITALKENQINVEEQFTNIRIKAIDETGVAGSAAIYQADTTILKEATLEQYRGYITQLNEVIVRGLAEGGVEGGKSAGELFNKQIEQILAKAPADMRDKILNLVGTTDFSTTTNIEQFVRDVQALGVKISHTEAKQLAKDFITLSNAINDVSLSSIIEQAKSLRDIADEIQDKDLSEGISEETYNELLKKNAIDPDMFYWTGQEYIYLGSSMEELARAIDDNTKELAEGKVQQLEERLANATEFENRLNLAKDNNVASLVIEGGMDDFLSGNASDKMIKDVLGLEGDDARAKYEIWLQDFLEKETIKSDLEVNSKKFAQMQTYGDSMYNITAAGYSDEQISSVIKAKVAVEGLAGECGRLKTTFARSNKELSKNEVLMIDLASAIKKSSQDYGKLNNVIKDNIEVLNNPNKDLGAYGEAIGKITQEASDAFGTVVSADFVEENIQKFRDIAEGGEAAAAAYKDLGKKLAIKMAEGFKQENPAQFITNLIDSLDGLSFDINGNFDASTIYEQFAKTAEEAERLQAYLSTLGYETSFDIWTEYEKNGIKGLAKSEEAKKEFKDSGWTEVGIKISAAGTKVNRPTFGDLGSNSGSGSGSTSEWENPYDKQYNILEQINEALRERENLEKDYQLLQKRGIVNGKDALNYYDAVFANLQKQIDLQKQLNAGRRQELADLLTENPEMEKYATYNIDTGLIDLKYDIIDAIEKSDEKTGEAVEKFVSEVERITESIEDSNDQIKEIENNQEDLKDQLVDTYLGFEDRIAAALEAIDQKEIDLLTEKFDALTEAENSLADSISKTIDEMRQARENEKTEEEIAEKERRLAYLRQDTTGSNALEIKRLEEEIAEQREGYQDALIDQALTNLQEQNEVAAEQRDKQIELMQSQLEYNVENGVYAKQVAGLIESAMEGDHMLTKDDELYGILERGEVWGSMTPQRFEQMMEELTKQLADSFYALKSSFGDSSNDANSSGSGNGGGTGSYDSSGYDREVDFTNNPYGEPKQPNEPNYKYPIGGDTLYSFVERYNTKEHPLTISKLVELNPDVNWADTRPTAEIMWDRKYRIYKTGGLADYTGPAWLDGTKSKPELVLNARDTENFIVLKDVLSSLLSNNPTKGTTSGDNYFDITIQVEEISNDYDVDQMAARIKQNIYEDSMYRNVNAINFLR